MGETLEASGKNPIDIFGGTVTVNPGGMEDIHLRRMCRKEFPEEFFRKQK